MSLRRPPSDLPSSEADEKYMASSGEAAEGDEWPSDGSETSRGSEISRGSGGSWPGDPEDDGEAGGGGGAGGPGKRKRGAPRAGGAAPQGSRPGGDEFGGGRPPSPPGAWTTRHRGFENPDPIDDFAESAAGDDSASDAEGARGRRALRKRARRSGSSGSSASDASSDDNDNSTEPQDDTSEAKDEEPTPVAYAPVRRRGRPSRSALFAAAAARGGTLRAPNTGRDSETTSPVSASTPIVRRGRGRPPSRRGGRGRRGTRGRGRGRPPASAPLPERYTSDDDGDARTDDESRAADDASSTRGDDDDDDDLDTVRSLASSDENGPGVSSVDDSDAGVVKRRRGRPRRSGFGGAEPTIASGAALEAARMTDAEVERAMAEATTIYESLVTQMAALQRKVVAAADAFANYGDDLLARVTAEVREGRDAGLVAALGRLAARSELKAKQAEQRRNALHADAALVRQVVGLQEAMTVVERRRRLRLRMLHELSRRRRQLGIDAARAGSSQAKRPWWPPAASGAAMPADNYYALPPHALEPSYLLSDRATIRGSEFARRALQYELTRSGQSLLMVAEAIRHEREDGGEGSSVSGSGTDAEDASLSPGQGVAAAPVLVMPPRRRGRPPTRVAAVAAAAAAAAAAMGGPGYGAGRIPLVLDRAVEVSAALGAPPNLNTAAGARVYARLECLEAVPDEEGGGKRFPVPSEPPLYGRSRTPWRATTAAQACLWRSTVRSSRPVESALNDEVARRGHVLRVRKRVHAWLESPGVPSTTDAPSSEEDADELQTRAQQRRRDIERRRQVELAQLRRMKSHVVILAPPMADAATPAQSASDAHLVYRLGQQEWSGKDDELGADYRGAMYERTFKDSYTAADQQVARYCASAGIQWPLAGLADEAPLVDALVAVLEAEDDTVEAPVAAAPVAPAPVLAGAVLDFRQNRRGRPRLHPRPTTSPTADVTVGSPSGLAGVAKRGGRGRGRARGRPPLTAALRAPTSPETVVAPVRPPSTSVDALMSTARLPPRLPTAAPAAAPTAAPSVALLDGEPASFDVRMKQRRVSNAELSTSAFLRRLQVLGGLGEASGADAGGSRGGPPGGKMSSIGSFLDVAPGAAALMPMGRESRSNSLPGSWRHSPPRERFPLAAAVSVPYFPDELIRLQQDGRLDIVAPPPFMLSSGSAAGSPGDRPASAASAVSAVSATSAASATSATSAALAASADNATV